MGRPPAVLMVNYEFPPWGGGSGNATSYVLRALSALGGVDVELLTSGPEPGPETRRAASGSGPTVPATAVSGHHGRAPAAGVELPGVKLHRIPIPKRERHYWTSREIGIWLRRALPAARRLAETGRYDLCHCWSGWPSGWIGYAIRRSVPYAVGLRGSDVPGYNPRLRLLDPIILRPVSRWVWSRAVAVTCVSDDLRDLARRTAPEVEYEVIRNGVDADAFRPAEPPERLTFLFVGRLIARKGVIDLVRAFSEVVDGGADCLLHIVGGGPDRGMLESFCRSEGLADRVTFAGAMESEHVPRAFRGASVFVMPSIEEAMSNAALEAMASGLPVITTPTGVSEILDGNGIVVERRNTSQLAAAMRRYASDPSLRERHARRSREIAEGLTWSDVARAYRNLYDSVCERARQGPVQRRPRGDRRAPRVGRTTPPQ